MLARQGDATSHTCWGWEECAGALHTALRGVRGATAGGSPAAALGAASAFSLITSRWLALQNPGERAQAEQALKVFGLSTEYVSHCKVTAPLSAAARAWPALRGRAPPAPAASNSLPLALPAARELSLHTHSTAGLCVMLYACVQTILDVSTSPYAQLLASSSLIKVVTEHTLA